MTDNEKIKRLVDDYGPNSDVTNLVLDLEMNNQECCDPDKPSYLGATGSCSIEGIGIVFEVNIVDKEYFVDGGPSPSCASGELPQYRVFVSTSYPEYGIQGLGLSDEDCALFSELLTDAVEKQAETAEMIRILEATAKAYRTQYEDDHPDEL